MALFGGKKKDNMNMPPLGMPDMNQDPNMPPPDMGQGQDYYGQQGQGGQQGYPDPNMPPPDMNMNPNQGYPNMGQGQSQGNDPNFQQAPDFSQQNFSAQQFSPSMPMDDTRERVEEIAEAIIDEKWNEMVKDINKVIEWKERTDGQITTIIQEIQNLKDRFESLHKGVLGKIGEYDQNLSNVGTEIKAMEKVFQQVLPKFTDSINKLERLSKGNK